MSFTNLLRYGVYVTPTPCFEIAKAYFAGFHCCENASAEVVTPISPKPAARASAAINIKGTAVVITRCSSVELSCAETLHTTKPTNIGIRNFFMRYKF